VESDKRLGLEALIETSYYEKQSEGTSLFILALGIIISIFFAAGAILGAVITMYGAVAQRQREIGTLRALGFSRLSILMSFLLESCLLALAGGLLGAAAAFCLGFVKVSMMNFATWQEISFSFDPNPIVLGVAIVFAVGMGVLGGFLPAFRAARVSPVEAMRV
jgi:putative ABC transport system permease protein